MIQLNDFSRLWNEIESEAVDVFKAFGKSAYYILGPEVKNFEAQLAKHTQIPFAVGCANGMDALEIALRATGAGAGTTVLTTPLSAFASTLAILRTGATPAFVDIDHNGLIDLDRVEAALQKDSSIKFILPVHLYGFPLDLKRLAQIKEKHGVTIIEDCAQAIGAAWNNQPVGSVGDAAGLSFYPTKNLGCFGDGGALLTTSAKIDAQARKIRDYGQSSKYVHDIVGMNSRLDEVQAALLDKVLLPRLNRMTDQRTQIASRYLAEIKNEAVTLPKITSEMKAVWHLFPLTVKRGTREAFSAHLKEHGIASASHYPGLISDQAALKSVAHKVLSPLETATRFAATQISIPIHPYLSQKEVAHVIQAINSWNPHV